MFDLDKYINQRRDFLVKALTAGLFSLTAPRLALAEGKEGKEGRKPMLPEGKSFYDLKGEVFVDGRQATKNTVIGPNSTVTTGKNGTAIFAVGQDAFLIRNDSQAELASDRQAVVTKKIKVVGKLLSVFGRRSARSKLQMQTGISTIGIRGTGVYLETDASADYLCTCYGMTTVHANTDRSSRAVMQATYHDNPRYIVKDAPRGKKIESAPFKDHSDEELALIESLLGREPPFGLKADVYKAPRRTDY